MEEKSKPRIKVTDRRVFTQDGERRNPDEESPRSESAAEFPPEVPVEGVAEGSSPFTEFVLSFAELAFLNLGKMARPEGGEPQLDLDVAGNMIDILQMLKTKTRGNLTPTEVQVLGNLLNQLQILFLQHAKGGTPKEPDPSS